MEMKRWRFFQKPKGLELYFFKLELSFTFFFFIFSKSLIKHPQAPQGANKVVPLFRGKELYL